MIINNTEQKDMLRLLTIKTGLELEMIGMRLTSKAKAPSCFSIIQKEFNLNGKDKVKCYREFCSKFGFKPENF